MPAPVNECVPLYRPGDQLTGHTSAAVTGKRFLGISAAVQAGPGLNTSTSGGNLVVAHAAAGAVAIGISNKDAAINTKLTIVGLNGGCYPVTADGTVTAGDEIMVGSAGKAKTRGNGAATAASATTGVVGSNNALTYTAKDAGGAGNGISIQILGSTGNSVSLAVAVNGNDIVVTPATNSGGTVASTASQVASAIAASGSANSLVTVTNTSTSTGAGVVAAAGPTNLSGGAEAGLGRLVGVAVTSATDGNDVYVLRTR